MTIIAAADGSALGNPGPAGWAWYVDDANWAAGGWPHSTNNRGELQAVLSLLVEMETIDEDLRILCDSKYVINCLTTWLPGWKKKGWKKADGKDVVNRDLIEVLDRHLRAKKDAGVDVSFEWVKGHNKHTLNEAADTRAHAAAQAFKAGKPVDAGPGYRAARSGAPDAASPNAAAPADAPEAKRTSAPDFTTVAAPAGDASPQKTQTVACPLRDDLAARIVTEAQRAGHSPQAELADLIRLGMERKYEGR